jgi:hypothetical protein
MESFTEKNGGFGSNRLVQQIEAEFSRNDTYITPAARGSEENLKARIEKVESEFNTTGILVKAKKETGRPSHRRRKIRVYLP